MGSVDIQTDVAVDDGAAKLLESAIKENFSIRLCNEASDGCFGLGCSDIK